MKSKIIKNNNVVNKKPNKPSQNYGKWIYKTTISTVLICICGNKYLKTRPNQITCVKCMTSVGVVR